MEKENDKINYTEEKMNSVKLQIQKLISIVNELETESIQNLPETKLQLRILTIPTQLSCPIGII